MIDLMALEPNKISRDITSYNNLIFGNPKSGKTTFAYKLYGQEALLLAFEKGYGALSGVIALDVPNYATMKQVIGQLKKAEVKSRFKTVIFDTADLFSEICVKQTLRILEIDDMSDLGYGKAYAKLDTVVKDVINPILEEGYKVCLSAHSKLKTFNTGKENEYSKYVLSLQNRVAEIVTKLVDNILFVNLERKEDGTEERVVYTRETTYFQAGTRFAHLPSRLPLDADVFKQAIKEAIEAEENDTGLATDEKFNKVMFSALNFSDIHSELMELGGKLGQAGFGELAMEKVYEQMGAGYDLSKANEDDVEDLAIVLENLKTLAEKHLK